MNRTRGTMAIDWEQHISVKRMRGEREDRALSRMRDAGPGSIFLIDDPNIRYVTGLAMTGGPGAGHYSLLLEDGTVVHWDAADHASNRRYNYPWLTDVHYGCPGLGNVPRASGRDSAQSFLSGKMAQIVVDTLDEHGLANEAVDINIGHAGLLDAFESKGIDARPAECAAMMKDARKTRTKDEIEYLRQVAAICEAGFQTIAENAKPGTRELEVWGDAIRELWRHGTMAQGGYLTPGPNTWPKHQTNTTDRLIRPGDLVYADFYNVGYLGYRSCYYRIFSMGEPTDEQRDAHETARDNPYAVLDEIEPGKTTDEIVATFPDIAGEHADWYGAGDRWQLMINHWAHGLGLQLYEMPLIWRGLSPDHPIEIEAGVTMVVETQEPAGRQGIRVEEMVAVRDGDVGLLSQWPVEEVTTIEYWFLTRQRSSSQILKLVEFVSYIRLKTVSTDIGSSGEITVRNIERIVSGIEYL